ncbi:H-NS family histone-like protein [Alishewanella sp. HL-SH06]|uniref:H-NS family histone-like protein n=1 Tax=Alishewanella sp. HL-SH06 TaxID=3461144 RepID=UPI004042E62A
MSLLLDKRELKKAAKELTLAKLNDVLDTLNLVLVERQSEIDAISEIERFAREKGFTLEQLGYKQVQDVMPEESVSVAKESKRPVKPKFKTLNKASQYFYVEDGQLQLLRTHTMKKGLQARGIEVVPVNKVDKKFAKDIERLLDEATEQATANFNSKVVVWNAWAAENGAEILEPR